ncbi:MAG: GNAT family N-acetyltransferase [Fibrobacterota bacterium]
MDKIITERLVLEPFSEKHLTERYVSWLNDPDVVRYSEQRHRKHSLETCRIYYESMKAVKNWFWAVIETKQNAGHIGNVTAYFDRNNQVVDIAIMIGEKALQGKGYGLEAWNGVLEFLKKQKDARKITAGTMAVNQPMLKIMEKSGMKDDGRKVGQFLYDDQAVDMISKALFIK